MARMAEISLLLFASTVLVASAHYSESGSGSGISIGSGGGECRPLLEAARGCNLWVRNDLYTGTGSVEGKVCVGGDMIAPEGFSLGTNLGQSTCEASEYSLVVAGDLTWPSGVKAARAHCIGGSHLDISDHNNPLEQAVCPEDLVESPYRCADVIDFESDAAVLEALSDALALGYEGFRPSAAKLEDGVIQIKVDANYARHVVELDASLFGYPTTWGMDITAVGGSMDDIEIVVVNLVNVPNSGLFLDKYVRYGEYGSTVPSKVLFNYPGTSSLSVQYNTLQGSVLAPRATLSASYSGLISGQLIVGSYQPKYGNAHVSLYNKPLATVLADNLLATARDITVELNDNGAASIQAEDVDDGSFGACGIDSMTVSPRHFDCSDVASGPVAVTLTVTDSLGKTATDTAYVTVRDSIPPVVITQDITVELDANGMATITAQQVDNGSHDACGIDSMTVDPATFDCSHVGAQTVTLTVTDVNGNVATATATATVQDSIPPVVMTQDLTVELDANGMATITAQQVDNGSHDACGIDSMTVDPATFDCSHVGAQTVTLTVTDVNGNVATATATATVQDSIPPVVITQDITVELDANGNATIAAQQVDNGSHDACGIESMVVFPPTFDCSHVGAQTVTLAVTDVNGNVATATATATVQDNVAPDVQTKDITVELDEYGTASIVAEDIDDGSSDACGIASMTLDPSSFSCSDVARGPVRVVLAVTDIHGNDASDAANVIVRDLIAPELVCKDKKVYLDLQGHGSLSVADLVNASSDNCGVAMVTASDTQFGLEDIGVNLVVVSAIDVNGQTSTCTANVEVIGGCFGECPGACMHTNVGDNSCTPLVPCELDDSGLCSSILDTLAPNNRNIPCDGGLCYCPAGSDYCGPAPGTVGLLGNPGSSGGEFAKGSGQEASAASTRGSAHAAGKSAFTWVTAVLVATIVVLSLALAATVRSARKSAASSAVIAQQEQANGMFVDLHGEHAHKVSPTHFTAEPDLSIKLQFQEAAGAAARRGDSAV